MAADLGFFVIAAKQQFISWPGEDTRLLDEVRSELGYVDLVSDTGPCDEIVGYLARGLPKVLVRTAERWAHFGPPLLEQFRALRRDVEEPTRSHLMGALRDTARALGADVEW
jgi:hypothetical protein